jgi:predicted TIM-barrel fold metal-dependent hydrolase
MQALATVDCHSHTMLRREYEAQAERSLFTLLAYFTRDVAGMADTASTVGRTGRAGRAGMRGGPDKDALGAGADDETRWGVLREALRRGRNVSYWRHHILTYQGLFDLAEDDVTDDNWAALNARIRERTARPGWFDYVVRTRCNLITQVRNVPWGEDWEPEYFTAIARMEPALRLHQPAVREDLAARTRRDVGDLAGARRAVAEYLADYVRRGAIGIKLGHAYGRSLSHQRVPLAAAEAIYARAVRGEELPPADVTALQDHMVWYLTELCAEHGLIFQIHTGMQSNWGHIPDSNPLHLLNLLQAFRSVRFDLFHAGYPYAREIGVLGKHYPNVWLNACWIYLITMAGSRQILSEWIDLVPADRLLGFGSDVGQPDLIYGHLVMARACLADVLAEKVQRDFLSEAAALDVARLMMRDAPLALYGLA